MKFLRKSTHTSIVSFISGILSIITRNKPKYQGLLFFCLFLTCAVLFSTPVSAIVNPLSAPNNRFGIHIIQATPDESSPAAALVNSNGDWGYVTVLIESKDRNQSKWQEFFNDLRRRHLIPLVRLATAPEGNFWKRPYEGEEQAWADFLDSLNWPVKNRYIIIYNEPNHATEWGNTVDAGSYAQTLDKTIMALKAKNQDFFVLNGGLDASAPSQPPRYEDETVYLRQMNQAVPGIFEKLDGWVSHSYPNPEFAGSPDASGKGTVRTYIWEINQLRSLGVSKNLPVFIAETGWKHAEGINLAGAWPSADTVAEYYKNAFENAWNNSSIVAVTPFLLSYQEAPFDHFSFKKIDGKGQDQKILGVENPNAQYYSMYQTLLNLPKVTGQPVQETKGKLIKGEVYTSIVSGETYTIFLTFKNTGQSVWNDRDQVKLVPITGAQELGITVVNPPRDQVIEPDKEYTFQVNLKAPQSGTYDVALNLFAGNKQFAQEPVKFTTQVKSPVILKVMGALGWKKNFEGDYVLKVKGAVGDSAQSISLNKEGVSPQIEARYLLPDYTFEFSLEKPFYNAKTIKQKVSAGENTLNFGTLNPDILSLILNPKDFLLYLETF